MATLVDWQISELSTGRDLISPYNETQVNPASYDVRMGPDLWIEVDPACKYEECSLSPDRRWTKISCADEPYILKPGEFILAATQEKLKVPPELEAVFQLKSSRGREGYQHVLSGYIDPGFCGNITLELTNINRYNDLVIAQDMLIGQVRFCFLKGVPQNDYSKTGNYQGDSNVQYSKTDIFGKRISDPDSGLVFVSIDPADAFPGTLGEP